jgi:hypothetical protein
VQVCDTEYEPARSRGQRQRPSMGMGIYLAWQLCLGFWWSSIAVGQLFGRLFCSSWRGCGHNIFVSCTIGSCCMWMCNVNVNRAGQRASASATVLCGCLLQNYPQWPYLQSHCHCRLRSVALVCILLSVEYAQARNSSLCVPLVSSGLLEGRF